MKIKKPRTPKIYNSPNIPYLEVDLKIVLEYLGLIKYTKKSTLLLTSTILGKLEIVCFNSNLNKKFRKLHREIFYVTF
jgi:hypothetical protein